MKAINLQIRKTIIEIIFAIIIVIGSYFIWDNLEINKYASFAANVHNYNTISVAETKSAVQDYLIPKTDENGLKNSGLILLENHINQEKPYKLILKINKDSTLDYRNLSIGINQKIIRLKNALTNEDQNYYYFILDEGNLIGKKELNASIWLNYDTTNESMGKSFSYSFDSNYNNETIATN